MMKFLNRKEFLKLSTGMGVGLVTGTTFSFGNFDKPVDDEQRITPIIKKGEKQLFVDDLMIANLRSIVRKAHAAAKLKQLVLEADMPWEQGDIYNGKRDRRIYIYGTVLRDLDTGKFRMWYNRLRTNYYATSNDGINWDRPNLGQFGKTNMINLFGFHSPSFIRDEHDPDPAKRYKAVGSKRDGYYAAYSADGLNWKLYNQNPVLLSSDTITLAQDPVSGEYLAFHKRSRDPRVRGRQVFLSVSKDMQTWSTPEPVMVTDEIDHQQARLLEGGTHAEFYNMSAFPYGNQWLGLVTLFQRTGEPPVQKHEGHAQSSADGLIDVQLVHSRDGREWERCSDRTPVIPLGPHHYDSGSILGVCNSPVIVGDEMWMYYTAMTTSHGGYLPNKEMSIARAAWRLDGMVSLQASEAGGMIETLPFSPEGNNLFVNTDVANGKLMVEVLDVNGKVIQGYEKEACGILRQNAVKLPIKWDDSAKLPSGTPIRLRFYLEHGDLYSYTIE